MLKKLLVATTNPGKLREIKAILKDHPIELVFPDKDLKVEEVGCSFLENAYLKAKAYNKVYNLPTLAEDSGLVIPAIDGYPGIFSSRFYQIDYGGQEPVHDSKDRANINKVLRLMKGQEDRRAYYYACAVLYFDEWGIWSEGTCYGEILYEPRGSGGFGYDPIFRPEGYDKSMAELSQDEKNKISHRGKAIRSMFKILNGFGE